LLQLGLGTVSKLPGTNAVLVTASSDQLAKAVAVLNVVDAGEPFAVRTIAPASAARTLPSNVQIEASVGGMSIGTFADPPKPGAYARAIIDIHGGAVIAIAPVAKLQDIVLAMESGPEVLKEHRLAAEQIEREKVLKATDPAEPNAPKAVVTAEQPAQQANNTSYLQGVADSNEDASLESFLAAVKSATTDLNEPSLEAKPEAKSAEQLGTQAEPKGAEAQKTGEISTPGAGSTPYEPEPVVNGEETLKLSLPERLSIVDLLGLVGEYLHLDYMYDPTKVQGEVALKLQGKLRGPMKVGDLYPLLESVLKFKGFVMTRKGNLVTIVPVTEAMEADPLLVDPETGKVKTGDVIVTRIFELQHVDTNSAINLLDSMKLSVAVVPLAETGTLIVTGYAYRMARIEQLLKVIDKPGAPRKFKFRQLRFTMAKTLAEKVKTLAEELGTVPVTISTGTTPTIRTPGIRTPTTRPSTPQPPRTPMPTVVTPSTPTKPSVFLDADERTNRVLMIGLEEQLEIVEQLIDALDVEQQDLRVLKAYQIEHVDATEVKKKLEELGIIGASQSTYTSTRITGGPATTAPGGTVQPPSQLRAPISRTGAESVEESLVEQPQVVVIEATNSLLVNATAEQHAQVSTIIGYVDSETLRKAIPYVIYPLENQKPEDLAGVLEKLIQETVKDKEGKVQQVIKKTEEEIVIVPDENTFSLIVYASQKNQQWIKNLIETLDKRRPQVLIDVTLVEISKTDKFEYDLNLINSAPDLVSTSGLTGVIKGTGTSAITTPDIISKLSTSGRKRFIDFQSNSGAGTGFYGDKHINVLLEAMQTKDYGRVLAKPKILVNDNEKGTIKTTDTTYVARKSSVPISTGTAGTQTSLIETSLDYTAYPAGISLDITPHISEGKLLRLEITLSRSDFTGTTGGDKPPDTTSSDITTFVTVPDGSTIILGGMLKLNQSKGGTKVPLLGDLPIVGGLFRSVSNSDVERKLYVFVKAEIIRPPENAVAALDDFERISRENRASFERHEMEFQNYQDIPGIKPQPMDPAKVLEAQ
jgi:type II secretory pathway component GspD/PulD (secretin)